MVDADGVALAAIQGLNAKLEAEVAAKNRELAELRSQLGNLQAASAESAALKRELAELRGAVEQVLARMSPDAKLARVD